MPVYKTRPGTTAYGYCVGILLLDVRSPFVPGDVGNATTYDYPVLYRTVPGATGRRVSLGDPDLEEAVVEAARELEAEGVKGISSDCAFFINYQDLVAKAVNVPVFLSSLLQIPFISSFLGTKRSVGLITANSDMISNRVIELSGIDRDRSIVIKGMQDEEEFGGNLLKGGEDIGYRQGGGRGREGGEGNGERESGHGRHHHGMLNAAPLHQRGTRGNGPSRLRLHQHDRLLPTRFAPKSLFRLLLTLL